MKTQSDSAPVLFPALLLVCGGASVVSFFLVRDDKELEGARASVPAGSAYFVTVVPLALAMAARALRDAAQECSEEISRVNAACGHVVFNPAITTGLREALSACGGPESYAPPAVEWSMPVRALAVAWLAENTPVFSAADLFALGELSDAEVQAALEVHYPGGVAAFLSPEPFPEPSLARVASSVPAGWGSVDV